MGCILNLGYMCSRADACWLSSSELYAALRSSVQGDELVMGNQVLNNLMAYAVF